MKQVEEQCKAKIVAMKTENKTEKKEEREYNVLSFRVVFAKAAWSNVDCIGSYLKEMGIDGGDFTCGLLGKDIGLKEIYWFFRPLVGVVEVWTKNYHKI